MTISCALTLEDAQAYEKSEIIRVRPKYNKYVASSPTRLGQRTTKKHKAAIKKALTGKTLSSAHKAKLWSERSRTNIKGTKHTAKTKEYLHVCAVRQFNDPEKRKRHSDAMRHWSQDYRRRKKRETTS